MRYFPIFLDTYGKTVLVVGGGEAASQKVRLALKSQARVHVAAPVANEELRGLAQAGSITLHARSFIETDLDDAALAFVASGDADTDARIAALALARGIPVNVVDRPEQCSFLTPAIVDRDPVIVAIGTEGAGPILAQGIKSRLEAVLPPRLGALARKAGQLRPEAVRRLRDGAARRAFWASFFFGRIRDAFLGGDGQEFAHRVEHAFEAAAASTGGFGRVALVGAGPGDPELLTLKAQRMLQAADVIVYDRLVGPAILEYARRDAQRICVGKTPGLESPSQDAINRVLVAHALQGRMVVRLKGGDPYIFGRGAEEQAALEAVGVPVDVVPGITAAGGCAASIKLPLTRRGENRSFTVLTAMAENGPAEHDWAHLAREGEAFAIYMGVGTVARTRTKLLDAGIDPATPVVVVENGTLETERTATGTVAALRETLSRNAIRGPAIIFVGVAPVSGTRVGGRAASDAKREMAETAA